MHANLKGYSIIYTVGRSAPCSQLVRKCSSHTHGNLQVLIHKPLYNTTLRQLLVTHAALGVLVYRSDFKWGENCPKKKSLFLFVEEYHIHSLSRENKGIKVRTTEMQDRSFHMSTAIKIVFFGEDISNWWFHSVQSSDNQMCLATSNLLIEIQGNKIC